MPQKNKPPQYLIIALVVVVFITFSLVGLYLFTPDSTGKLPLSRREGTSSETKNSNNQSSTPDRKPNQGRESHEGYIQEFSEKNNIIDGLVYTRVIGLLDKSGAGVPIWITDHEFDTLKVFDLRSGSKKEILLNMIKGGSYVRVTRITDLSSLNSDSQIEMELLSTQTY